MDKDKMTEIINYLKDTAEFTKEQLPSVAAQLLEYGYIANLAGVILFSVLTVISFCMAFVNRHDMPLFSYLTSMFCGTWAIYCLDGLMMVVYAPKAYLLSYFKGIL